MITYKGYNLDSNVLTAIDMSRAQENYFMKYSNDALFNQRSFFDGLGISEIFERRVVLAGGENLNILRIEDTTFSGYTGNSSNCNGVNGLLTSEIDLPLATGIGDCPQLMVAGKQTVGILHAGRHTLDSRIIEKYFEKFLEYESIEDCKIGLSPYIFADYFPHREWNPKRDDWGDAIQQTNGVIYVDLKKMISKDLGGIGIPEKNIFDARVNTYEMSEISDQNNGYQISHRQSSDREGRGFLLIMLTQSCKKINITPI